MKEREKGGYETEAKPLPPILCQMRERLYVEQGTTSSLRRSKERVTTRTVYSNLMNYKDGKPYCTEEGLEKETQLLPKSKSNYGLGHIAESAICTRKQEMRFVRAGVIRAVPERGQREDSTVHPERGEREDMTIYWLLWHWYGRLVFLHYSCRRHGCCHAVSEVALSGRAGQPPPAQA